MKILKLNLPSRPKPTANCVVTTQKTAVQTSTQFQTKPSRIPVQHSVATTQKTAVQTSSNRVETTQQTVQTALTTTGRVAAGTPQTLPENVRAEARERLRFLQYIQQQKMLEPRTPDPMIVAKVAAARVEEFPILRQSGQRGASQLTYNNYRNWQRRLNEYRSTPGAVPGEGDLHALATNYKRGGSVYKTADGIPAYGDRQFWLDFNAAYLNQNKLDLTVARQVAAFALRQRDPSAVVPSVSQVRSYVKSLPLEVLIAGREGEVAWRNTICDYINRDWNSTEPGELLIGDSRDFDTRVRYEVEPGKWIAVRPHIACLMDARSWYPAAWTITVKPVNADIIMRTLLDYICKTNGQPPAMCYFDNGKDYCKQGFSTPLQCGKYEHSIFKELGIVLTNAKPFNARAKTVERFFRDMMKSFDKYFPDYLGSNPMERPDSAAYFDKAENVMELPTLEAFTGIFADWVASYTAKPKTGEIHRGKSPAEIWEQRNPDLRVMSPEDVAFAFMLPIGIRTVARGPAVTFLNRRYFSDEVRVGEKVLIKANPFDPEMVLLCREDGSAISIARTRLSVKAIAGDDGAAQHLLAEQLERQNRQKRECRNMLSQLTGDRIGMSAIEFMLSLGSDQRFIRRGSINTIKGKSHTYKRIAPAENVFDAEEKALEERFDFTAEPPEMPINTADHSIDDMLADEAAARAALSTFHDFMLNKKEDDYED